MDRGVGTFFHEQILKRLVVVSILVLVDRGVGTWPGDRPDRGAVGVSILVLVDRGVGTTGTINED